jgi:hypothetical protein
MPGHFEVVRSIKGGKSPELGGSEDDFPASFRRSIHPPISVSYSSFTTAATFPGKLLIRSGKGTTQMID